jgi:EAL and modified HD-GYP domain-containing signal transduction protein
MKYLARPPILNRGRELFVCELLFRSSLQNSCDGVNLDVASTSVLDTSFLIGFETIKGGHPMFINCPSDFLVRDYVSLFPPKMVVIEILETVKPGQEIVEAC